MAAADAALAAATARHASPEAIAAATLARDLAHAAQANAIVFEPASNLAALRVRLPACNRCAKRWSALSLAGRRPCRRPAVLSWVLDGRGCCSPASRAPRQLWTTHRTALRPLLPHPPRLPHQAQAVKLRRMPCGIQVTAAYGPATTDYTIALARQASASGGLHLEGRAVPAVTEFLAAAHTVANLGPALGLAGFYFIGVEAHFASSAQAFSGFNTPQPVADILHQGIQARSPRLQVAGC